MKNIKFKYLVPLLTAVLIVGGCVSNSNSSNSKPLRIVCIGDSLTACGGEGGKYTDWLSQWLSDDEVINKGIGGDTLDGGRRRFERDVLALHPDIVVIELGANDFWRRQRTIDQLAGDLEYMVKSAKDAGIEVVIASCFGRRDYKDEAKVEFDTDRYDFGEAIWHMEEQICGRYDCEYVPNMQVDIKPNGTPPYWGDNNHPNKAGNELVARQILPAIQRASIKIAK